MTDAHNPRLLSDADAAADLAGVPRPDCGAPKYASEASTEELLLTSKQPDALHLADALEKDMQYPLHGKAADTIRTLVSERDALAVRVRELEANAARYLGLLNKAREALAVYQGFIDDAHILEGQWHWLDDAKPAAIAISAALTTPESKP